jgi:hypothetical protein
MKKERNPFLSYFLIGYFIMWQIMTIYFWYAYSQEHSFWETVISGFFVAEFKGLFWVFLIW